MTAVGITENVKGDVKKFEIWYSGREEVYVVQVRSLKKFHAGRLNTGALWQLTAALNPFSQSSSD